MKHTDNPTSQPVARASSVSVLDEGKSSRLLKMRQKAFANAVEQPATDLPPAVAGHWAEAEFEKIRKRIDRRLQELLSRFPPDKRQRFFKIRYGMTSEQLKQQPISRILEVLKLEWGQSAHMKCIADLDYNGRPCRQADREMKDHQL